MATFKFLIRSTADKSVSIELRFLNGRRDYQSLITGFIIHPSQWDKSLGLPLDNRKNKQLIDNLKKLKAHLIESFNKANTSKLATDKLWLRSKVDEWFFLNKIFIMEKFIVAEISKNWDGNFDQNTPLSELINRKFETVINTNYKRGYNLIEWKFTTTVVDGHLIETIIAIFQLDEIRVQNLN